MAVNLYTFKKIYGVLGIEGYGVYDLIGGIIMLFSFLNESMTRSTQRFMTFELGKKNIKNVKKIFSGSLFIHSLAAFFIFIIVEIIGYFFLFKLNIPIEKQHVANVVFHFTAISFCFQIIRVPFNSTIISYEKMSFFVWIGIVEVVLQLIIAFVLPLVTFDKLISYSLLICITNFVILTIFIVYCIKTFYIVNFKIHKDWNLKTLLSFSGWSLLGSSANVCNQQGTKILLNAFSGISVNAAMGITNKISYGLYSLVSSFQKAFEPQLVKLYARKDKNLIFFIFSTSKLSYFLLLLIVLPFVFNIDFLFSLWLKEVPEYSSIFTILTMVFLLIDAISAPLWITVSATGKIKLYQTIVSFLIFLNLPISLVVLSQGYPPYYLLLVRILINLLTYVFRIFYVEKTTVRFAKDYFSKVVLHCLFATAIVLPVFFIISNSFIHVWLKLVFSILVNFTILPLVIYIVGLSKLEKDFLNKFVMRNLKYAR
jgi:O-antigen/teichoic acid export membrane protein